MRRVRSPKQGITIVEVIVVLGIIAVLLGVLFPAIQSFRQSARDMACVNNLRQFNLALEQVRNSKPRLPDWKNPPGTTGGWSVAVLPFIDPVLGANISSGVMIDSLPEVLRKRPVLFTCPVVKSDPAGSPADRMHYVLTTMENRREWFVMDAPINSADSWLAGIELPINYQGVGPHRKGFNKHSSSGRFMYVGGLTP